MLQEELTRMGYVDNNYWIGLQPPITYDTIDNIPTDAIIQSRADYLTSIGAAVLGEAAARTMEEAWNRYYSSNEIPPLPEFTAKKPEAHCPEGACRSCGQRKPLQNSLCDRCTEIERLMYECLDQSTKADLSFLRPPAFLSYEISENS